MLRTKSKMLKLPFRGLNTMVDPYFLDESFFPLIQNLQVDSDGIKRREGYETWAEHPTNDKIIKLENYSYAGTGWQLIGFSSTKLYKFENNAFVRVGTNTFLETKYIWSDVGFDCLFWATGQEKPKYWRFDMTDFTDIPGLDDVEGGGVVSNANIVCSFANFLLLAYTVEDNVLYRTRIRWSRFGDYTNWKNNPDGTGMAGYLDLNEETTPIIAMLPLKDFLVVYKPNCIYLLSFVGVPYIFVVKKVIEGIGLVSPFAVANFLDYHIFVGENNIYLFNGHTIQPIGDIIINFFNNKLNQTYKHLIKIFPDILNKKVFIFFPSLVDENKPGCDLVLVYNFLLQSWQVYDIPPMLDVIKTSKTFDITWDSSSSTWDATTRSWQETQVSGGFDNVFITYDKLYALKQVNDDSSIQQSDCILKTKIFDFGNSLIVKRLLEVSILGLNLNNLKLRVWYGDDVYFLPYMKEYTVGRDGKVQMDISAKFFQFDILLIDSNKPVRINNILFRWLDRGLR